MASAMEASEEGEVVEGGEAMEEGEVSDMEKAELDMEEAVC